MSTPNTLVWFRQDLRLHDNPALSAAVDLGKILPVYIEDTTCPQHCELGGASKWWLHCSLNALNTSLNEHLIVLKGDPKSLLPELAKRFDCQHIVWNRCYEPWQISRDKQLKQELKESGLQVTSYNASLLWEPMTILNQQQQAYKVFTPYYRKGCLQAQAPRYPIARPTRIDYVNEPENTNTVEKLDYLPHIDWYATMQEIWQPGEEGAKQRLAAFLDGAIAHYHNDRDFPGIEGTSKLSPHLHFGEISPHQIWYAVLDNHDSEQEGVDTYMKELGWREFSYYLLYHWPELPKQNFNQKFDDFPWLRNDEYLNAWQRGNTGIPIVDAGMRELWQTGYIHNRVRMIVGSFLVKNLLLDWRLGERWFWDCLLDADLASNSASWQWIAGSGADAAPYFRIFNPILQGEKFDKNGDYVRHYCPELAKLPNKYIHKPWEAPKDILRACKVALGTDYPEPIVELKASRQRALDAFATLKDKQ